ncbi:HNH endonuclease [Streptomyces sp. NPDC085946]|uniref:HNH endonuclease n=1 Tax=Streptomyces sp. NPDC085946 TaxID=3365744 RepID=UPI0037D19B82
MRKQIGNAECGRGRHGPPGFGGASEAVIPDAPLYYQRHHADGANCPLCKQALIVGAEYEPDSPREWINWLAASKKMLHKHHFTYRRAGGTDERNNLRLVHSECHRQHHAGDGERPT